MIFIGDQCVRRSPSSMWWAEHVLETQSLVHQPTQTWSRSRDSPSCAKRGPGGLSGYHLFFDKVTWLFNLPVFFLLAILFVFMVILTFLEHCYHCYSFCTMCLCLWWRKAGFEMQEKRGGQGVCMRTVWVLHSVSDRKRVRKWVREMLSIGQRKQFFWFGYQWSSELCDYHLKRQLSCSRSLLSFSFLFTVLLSQSQCTVIWLRSFSATICLTKPSVLSVLLNCIRLA